VIGVSRPTGNVRATLNDGFSSTTTPAIHPLEVLVTSSLARPFENPVRGYACHIEARA
jgi:hypothetical protein